MSPFVGFVSLASCAALHAAAAAAAAAPLGTSCPGGAPAGWQRATAPHAAYDACAFRGARTAWLGVFEGDGASLHAVVLRTRDGGATWTRSTLGTGEPRYTTWSGGPRMSLRFASGGARAAGARDGELDVVDMPQHHNGHQRTRASFVTRDGGRTWQLRRVSRVCVDRAGRCGRG